MKRTELKEFADCEKKLYFIENVLRQAESSLRDGDTLEISVDDHTIKEYIAEIAKAYKQDILAYISAIKVDYTKVNM